MKSPKNSQRHLALFLSFLVASTGLVFLVPSNDVSQPLLVETKKLSLGAKQLAPDGDQPSDGTVSVFYYTTRAEIGSKNGEPQYSSQISLPSFGIAHVQFPEDSETATPKPSGFSMANLFRSTKKLVEVRDVVPLPKDQFGERLRQDADRSGEVLLFVHGYNVSFEKAALCTAQLVNRLGFEGTAIMYSWPSQARPTVSDYWIDTASVMAAAPHFKDLLCRLTCELRHAKIHVVAHSLGSMLVGSVLASMSADQGSSADPIFDQIVFAAPDIDIAAFKTVIAPSSRRLAKRITVYVSRGDLALSVSKQMHGKRQRLGQMVSKMMSIDGVDTVDVSTVNSASLGHSYFSQSQAVIDDISSVLQGWAPEKRELNMLRLDVEGQTVWTLQKSEEDSTHKLGFKS